MTKINKEEYEILKGLDDKWKWIARDEDKSLWVCTEKPHKDIRGGEWGPDTTQFKCLRKCEILFEFIQWEDEEPHNIAELIKEYEDKEFYDYVGWEYHKSEESEVKDIEWLKREIHKELEAWHGVEGGIDGDGINEIMLLINQFEESKVKQLYKKIRELESYNDELIRDNNQLRNALDNQEVLSEEWIERNTSPVNDEGRLYVWKRDLQNAIVPKPEVPVIPKFVADAIEDSNHMYVVGFLDTINKENEELKKVWEWVESKYDAKWNLLARAWLDGFTLEEEQKYIVSDNSSIPLLIKNDDGKVMAYDSQIAYNNANGTIELTEQEIKDYDERYFAFAVKVEEMGE